MHLGGLGSTHPGEEKKEAQLKFLKDSSCRDLWMGKLRQGECEAWLGWRIAQCLVLP